MAASKRDDLLYGLSNEVKHIPTFNEFFGTTFTRQAGYSVMDYVANNNTVYLELKTRRITYNQYPTILVGQNKIDFCKDHSKTYYFAWAMNNGIYYIKYDKEVFDTFDVEVGFQRGDRSDCYDRPSDVVHVPMNLLTKLSIAS